MRYLNIICGLLLFNIIGISQSCPSGYQQKNQFCIRFEWADGEPPELPTQIENISGGAGGGAIFTEVTGIGSTTGSGDIPFIKFYGAGSSSCNASGYSGGAGDWRITYPSGTVDCSYDAGGTTLPVEFGPIYLKKDDGVIIHWSTKSEINNDFFAIERSKDGNQWQEIGSINGSGTSQLENEYSYWDSKPLNGISHYKIKQVDFDNSFSYSEIVSYINPLSTSNVILRTASEELIIDNEDEHKIYAVRNMGGQIILSGKLNKGRNLISVPELQPGVHIVTISGIIAQSFKVISF